MTSKKGPFSNYNENIIITSQWSQKKLDKMIGNRIDINLTTRIKFEIADILIYLTIPLKSDKLTQYVNYVTIFSCVNT